MNNRVQDFKRVVLADINQWRRQWQFTNMKQYYSSEKDMIHPKKIALEPAPIWEMGRRWKEELDRLMCDAAEVTGWSHASLAQEVPPCKPEAFKKIPAFERTRQVYEQDSTSPPIQLDLQPLPLPPLLELSIQVCRQTSLPHLPLQHQS